MTSEPKKRWRRAWVAVQILYHGFSTAALRDEIKLVWRWLAGWVASLPLLFEPVRDWLSDPTTYHFLVTRIGYVPVLYGIFLLAIAVRRTYRRGLAHNEADRVQRADAPSHPVLGHADTASVVAMFQSFADDAMTVVTFLTSAAQYAPHQVAEHEVRLYALIDNLSGLRVNFPTDVKHATWRDHALMLVALMRNGNLDKARQMFPLQEAGE